MSAGVPAAVDRAGRLPLQRREVREATGLGHTQLKVHLERLVELEYVLVHRGRRGQSFVTSWSYDGQGKDGRSFLPGWPRRGDAATRLRTMTTWRGHDADLAGARSAAGWRPERGDGGVTKRSCRRAIRRPPRQTARPNLRRAYAGAARRDPASYAQPAVAVRKN